MQTYSARCKTNFMDYRGLGRSGKWIKFRFIFINGSTLDCQNDFVNSGWEVEVINGGFKVENMDIRVENFDI